MVTENAPPPLPAAPWQAGAATFAQLGVADRRVTGPGERVLTFYFLRPSGWLLQNGSTLELDLAATTALRPDLSWVQVAVNGIVVGAREINRAEGAVERMRFDLPAELLTTAANGQPLRALNTTVQFFLALPEIGCTQVAPEIGRAAGRERV